MRKLLVFAVALVVLVAPAAHALVDGVPVYFKSDNVEYIGFIPLENDTAGARVVGKYFYITTSRGVTIYDLSDPEAPARLGTAVLPQEVYFAEEDVDTNGKILLIGTLGTLYVFDVEDKSNPKIIGELAGADEHTISCVLDCTYAYGSEGVIVDLRNPTKPKAVGNWSEGTPASGGGHDVTEVAPGLVVTSTQPLMLLDARKNPATPKVLAIGGNKDGRFMHSNLWPHQMRERFLLAGGESSGPSCGETDGAFMTWDTRNWRSSHSFKMTDEYRVKNGLYTDGDSPANLYCMHWFDVNPRYKNGGLVAVAWYEHGTRLLNVSSSGKIKEAGYFIPLGGSTSAAYWITDEILYTADYNRGVDIIRVKN